MNSNLKYIFAIIVTTIIVILATSIYGKNLRANNEIKPNEAYKQNEQLYIENPMTQDELFIEDEIIADDGNFDENNISENIEIIEDDKEIAVTILTTPFQSKTTAQPKAKSTSKPSVPTTPKPTPAPMPYYLKVNRTQNVVNIYALDENGNYSIPYKVLLCSTGTSTPKAGQKYKITTYRRAWNGLKGGVYGQYAVQITGNILFHSVPYTAMNNHSLEYWEYDKLGTKASMGCIRLAVQDAKWIFDNVGAGTWVEFYEDENPGPLGKPIARIISNNELCRDWDPTDYVENNPWHSQNIEDSKPEEFLEEGTEDNLQLLTNEEITEQYSPEISNENEFEQLSPEITVEDSLEQISSETQNENEFEQVSSEIAVEDSLEHISSEIQNENEFEQVSPEITVEDNWEQISSEIPNENEIDQLSSEIAVEDNLEQISSEIPNENEFGQVSIEMAVEDALEQISNDMSVDILNEMSVFEPAPLEP